MKVSFDFATVASLMVVLPFSSTLVPKLGVVQMVEATTFAPRSIVQDQERSLNDGEMIFRKKGSKKNGVVGDSTCRKCFGNFACWNQTMVEMTTGVAPMDPFNLFTFQKPQPTEATAIGGPGSFGGVTPHSMFVMQHFGTALERTYTASHRNMGLPTKVAYKQGPDEKSEQLMHELPYVEDFEGENEKFLEIIVNNYNTSGSNEPIKMKDLMAKPEMSVDGVLVMKEGKILVEHYRNGFNHRERHILFSATKSYTGVMLAMMIEHDDFKNKISYDDKVIKHVRELDIPGGAYQTVTVRELMDMTVKFIYSEANFDIFECMVAVMERFYCATDPYQVPTGVHFNVPEGCELVFNHALVLWPETLPREYFLTVTKNLYARSPGPQSFKDSIMNLKDDKTAANGESFDYLTPNTNVMGWIIESLTKDKGLDWFSDNLWSRIGAHSDMLVELDNRGFIHWGGGAHTTLRDAAIFAEMMRNHGKNYKNEQVVPEEIVKDIIAGGTTENQKQFAKSPSYMRITNCAHTSAKDRCEDGFWSGKILPEDIPVRQYLKAIGEDNPYGIESGMAYRNQYWTVPHHMIQQEGVYGQRIVFFPKANITTVIFSSRPSGGSGAGGTWNMLYTIAANYANKKV